MIIVLKGADFSANNVGKINISSELHSFTKAAIEASGNVNLTNAQKYALDDLFLAMGVDGSNDTMSKIRRLYLPIIANDVSKALINYNTSDFVVDKVLSSDNWELRSNGLVGKKAGQNIVLTESNILTADNFSTFFLRTETMVEGIDDGTYVITHRGKSDESLFLGARQQSVSSHQTVSFGEYGASWGETWKKNTDAIKASGLTNINGILHYCKRGEWGSKVSPSVTSDMSQEASQTVYVFGLNTVQTTKPYAVAMVGEGIDPDIAKNICKKIDALYKEFA